MKFVLGKLWAVAAFLMWICQSNAQVAKWEIPMAYDSLKWMAEDHLVIGIEGENYYIWTDEGKRLANSADDIHAFRESRAVATAKGTNRVTSFFDNEGKKYSIDNYEVTYNQPYFSGGYLLVRTASSDSLFYYVDLNGDFLPPPFELAYPFMNGYAAGRGFLSPNKLKDPYYLLLGSDGKELTLVANGKEIDKGKLDFVSSVNDEGLAVVIYKDKVYLFDGQTRELNPLYRKSGEVNPKRQVTAEVKEGFYRVDSNKMLKARYNNEKKEKEEVRIFFDEMMRPTGITFTDTVLQFPKREMKQSNIASSLKKTAAQEDFIGLTYRDAEFLPPQFKEVRIIDNDKAIVRRTKKYGLMGVDPNNKLTFKINDNKDVGFRHKEFKTTVQLDIPSYVSPKVTDFDPVDGLGVTLDKKSLDSLVTKFGNSLSYSCTLQMPDTLSAYTSELEYQFQAFYDNFYSPILTVPVKAWHLKYLNVVVDESNATFEKGIYTFFFDVEADKSDGEGDYPFTVSLLTDSLQLTPEKITEKRYKCEIPLAEGDNKFSIVLYEDGVPPSENPYVVTYNKPTSSSSRNEPKVIIKKVPVYISKPTPKQHKQQNVSSQSQLRV